MSAGDDRPGSKPALHFEGRYPRMGVCSGCGNELWKTTPNLRHPACSTLGRIKLARAAKRKAK